MAKQSPVPGTNPGDRGDGALRSAMSGLAANKSPHMKPRLKTACSKGYEPAPSATWGGNVRR